jgi:hypothetical protein
VSRPINEAPHRRLIALDPHIPCALGIDEWPAPPQHCGQGVGVGVDLRVGLVGLATGDLDLIA